ncbi:MAG: BatA domain-containing protein [Phycisphaerae bacterium]
MLLPMIAMLPFVSPGLFAAGAACVSIPIIIHLLNRRRFRQKPWAAMQFLIAAYRRNVRRLKLQRLLLLLLRCLAILLIAAGIAQFIPISRGLAALMGSGSRLTIVVWNNAYPMGYVPASGQSPFAESRRLLTNWSRHLPGGEWTAVIGASSSSGPLLEKPVPASPSVTSLIARQKVTQGSPAIAAALMKAAALARAWRKRVAQVRVWLVSDETASDFGCRSGNNPLAKPTGALHALRRAVKAIGAAGARLRVFDVGRPDAANMAVTELRFTRPAVLIGHDIHLRLKVLNSGAQAEPNVSVRFLIDGVSAGQQTIGTIRPWGAMTAHVLLPNPIELPGLHDLTVRIAADGLPIDDIRQRVFRARTALKVLLVDGRPGDPAQGVLASTAWLEAALAPADKGNRFAPRRIEIDELPGADLQHYAAVVLSDIAPPGAADIQRLERYVKRGGTLMIYPGGEADPSAWTHAGGGLLPAAYGTQIRTPATAPQTLDVTRSARSIVAPFIAAQRQGIHTGIFHVAIHQYLQLIPTAHAQVLLKMRGGEPLLAAEDFGRGRVAMWGTSCDTQWTDLPAQPAFLPLIYRVFDQVLVARGARHNLLVGRRLVLAVHHQTKMELRGPGGTTIELTEMLAGAGKSRHLQLAGAPIDAAGVYRTTAGVPVAAVNVDAAAGSNIAHIAARAAAECFSIPASRIVTEPEELRSSHGSATGPAGNIGWLMLMLGLFILASEALAARAFSRYRLSTQTTGVQA